jgi:hypothetical protein
LFSFLRPGDPIRSVDPIVFNRIRVGFHRKPTSFIKNRSHPTWFLSDSYRSDLVGFHRVPSNSDEIRAGFRPIGIRQKSCRIRHRLFRFDRIRPPMNLLGKIYTKNFLFTIDTDTDRKMLHGRMGLSNSNKPKNNKLIEVEWPTDHTTNDVIFDWCPLIVPFDCLWLLFLTPVCN